MEYLLLEIDSIALFTSHFSHNICLICIRLILVSKERHWQRSQQDAEATVGQYKITNVQRMMQDHAFG